MSIGLKHSNKIIKLAVVILGLIALAWLSQRVFFRVDLTSEKRYTLTTTSREFMNDLSSELYVKVYLEGELNSGFRRLSNASREMLEEFKSEAGRSMHFEFVNFEEQSSEDKKSLIEELAEFGFEPQSVFENAEDGLQIQSYVFPYALVYYKERIVGVNLLDNLPSRSGAENLNTSIESLEYKFTSAFRKLISEEKSKIAFLEGHGELDELDVIEATDALSAYYQVDRGQIGNDASVLNAYKAIIIAKPSKPFSEKDKFVLDQYLMNGGRLLYLIDAVNVTLDSLRQSPQTLGLYNDVNLDDQLFRYGVRVNPVLIEDIQAGRILMNANPQGQTQLVPVPWLYSPLLGASQNHPITRNINLVRGGFAGTIDTVGNNLNISRHILLRSSQYTKLNKTPVFISMADVNKQPKQQEFNAPYQTVAVVQEGKFPSVFKNRNIPEGLSGVGDIRTESRVTRMMVVADGDIIRNDVRFKQSNPKIERLGYDEGSGQMFGNKDFIVNAVNYLCDEDGWMQLRGRHLTLRLLDKQKLSEGTSWLKWLNVVLPILLVCLGSVLFIYIRYRRFGK
ncbi:gliding motility-associated ABC transporter substrate-binding protein GldG [Carboxylicivirga marina]|uniref:Gliding motility-associated ABC transporter substrate-binding protein GldG n=1 Tax=Carboxylicivirga marina TaxID=2800988 RepID=A0ABS1HLT8_9BACT|nr:gliding motility-associated ABC transporter substrate-binding protein GldG [Carboxylicivirga marina]MBK3518512.1 gliding motility-associated ABC transporter substrate-binding protein GldG [Carboxylicivirga marina]